MALIKDKEVFEDGKEKFEVVLRPAPWNQEEDAIQVPYSRKDGQISRSSPTLPIRWAVGVAIAGVRKFFPEESVAVIMAECVKRLAK